MSAQELYFMTVFSVTWLVLNFFIIKIIHFSKKTSLFTLLWKYSFTSKTISKLLLFLNRTFIFKVLELDHTAAQKPPTNHKEEKKLLLWSDLKCVHFFRSFCYSVWLQNVLWVWNGIQNDPDNFRSSLLSLPLILNLRAHTHTHTYTHP